MYKGRVLLPPENGLPYLRGVSAGSMRLAPGSVAVRDGRVAALDDDPGAAVRIDASGGAVLPGPVDRHTHLPFVGLRGEGDEQKATGVFNIVDDDPAPVAQWLPYLAKCAGAKPPLRLPKWLGRMLAGDQAVAMMTQGRGSSNAKAKEQLGWQLRYPSWRQGFQEALA